MKQFRKKEIAFERVIFFSDAVVAIAITLLVFNLKVTVEPGHHLTFKDLIAPWRSYAAFTLSFLNIAGFWRRHHNTFIHIKQLDERLLTTNIIWLFCIVTLPFTTTLLSEHFAETPAVFLYSLTILLIAVMQNTIWDYADNREGFINKEEIDAGEHRRYRLLYNLEMINGLIALVVSFFNPELAFILLFFKIPMFILATIYLTRIKKQLSVERKRDDQKE